MPGSGSWALPLPRGNSSGKLLGDGSSSWRPSGSSQRSPGCPFWTLLGAITSCCSLCLSGRAQAPAHLTGVKLSHTSHGTQRSAPCPRSLSPCSGPPSAMSPLCRHNPGTVTVPAPLPELCHHLLSAPISVCCTQVWRLPCRVPAVAAASGPWGDPRGQNPAGNSLTGAAPRFLPAQEW